MDCEHVPLSDCLTEAIEFRNRNRQDHRDAEYFTWRYLDRPCEVGAYVVWVSDDGEKLGASTVAPHDFLVDGEPVRLGIVGDISVAPEAQGRGIGSRLLKVVREQLPPGVDDVLVLPNDAARGPLERAGWVPVGEIERRVRLLSGGRASGLAHSAIAFLTGTLAGLLGGRVRCRFDAAEESLEEIDALWSAANLDGLAMARRDSAYLRWRYQTHPATRYDVTVARMNDEPVGWVVSHTIGDARWIDDFVISDASRALDIVRSYVENDSKGSGRSAIHTRSLGTMSQQAWSRNGFIRRGDTQSVMVGGTILGRTRDTRWYLTAGDKDV